MKCKDCNSTLCSYRTSDAEKDCFYESHPDYPMPRDLWNNDNTDWRALRNQAAIAAMQGMLANPELLKTADWGGRDYRWNIEQQAVLYANALVEKLKKK